MTRTTLIAALAVLTAPAIEAQEGAPAVPDFSPAKQAASFDKLLGNWEGSGTVVPMPGNPELKWTSKANYRKVLNGHFVQVTDVIDLGEMGTLVIGGLLGWDRENKRYVSMSASNMGGVSFSELTWAGTDTMVVAALQHEEGKRIVERWTTRIGKDEIHMLGERAIDDGKMFTYVKGSLKRVEKGIDGVDMEKGLMPPAPEMAKLAAIVGVYAVKGNMKMSPEAPAMQISGTDSMKMLFGGSVLAGHVSGDPVQGMPKYDGMMATGWDPSKNCYTMIFASNLGECGTAQMRWIDGQLVATSSSLMMGQPVLKRTILTVGKNGIEKITEDSLQAAAKPMRSFEATYERQNKQ